MSTEAQSQIAQSNTAVDPTQRQNILNYLTSKGYEYNTLWNLTNDELLGLSMQEGQAESDYRKTRTDRSDAFADFKNQLGQLTSAKQRQAELAGRVQQRVQRTSGLAQMMSNF